MVRLVVRAGWSACACGGWCFCRRRCCARCFRRLLRCRVWVRRCRGWGCSPWCWVLRGRCWLWGRRACVRLVVLMVLRGSWLMRTELDWSVRQLCRDCGREMVPQSRRRVRSGRVVHEGGGRCEACTTRRRREASRLGLPRGVSPFISDAEVADRRWMASAACAGMERLFEQEGQAVARTREVCGRCPVRSRCLETALALEAGTRKDGRFGMWGGRTPQERLELARERARAVRDGLGVGEAA